MTYRPERRSSPHGGCEIPFVSSQSLRPFSTKSGCLRASRSPCCSNKRSTSAASASSGGRRAQSLSLSRVKGLVRLKCPVTARLVVLQEERRSRGGGGGGGGTGGRGESEPWCATQETPGTQVQVRAQV